MMKPNRLLAGIISTAAVTGGVLLASFHPTSASACLYGKSKGINSATAGDSPNSGLISHKYTLKNMGIAGIGFATIAGVVAAGAVYKLRRTRLEDTVAAEVPFEHPEVSSATVGEEVLYVPMPQEKVSDANSQKDLTPVG
jgi:hypothetical protein